MQIHGFEQFPNRLGSHFGGKLIAKLLAGLLIFLLGHQLVALEGCHAWVNDHEGFKIKHPFNFAQRHVQQQCDSGGQRLQKPNVGDRAGQFDVPHAFAAHLGQSDFHPALFTDDSAVL